MALDLNEIRSGIRTGAQPPKSIVEAFSELMNKNISFFGKTISDKRKEYFYSEMYILISSGVDMKTAFDIMEEQAENEQLRQLYSYINQQVISGANLSDALHSSGHFSQYEYHSLRIGEESGQLVAVLKSLHEYFDIKVKQTRKLVNSLSYPVLVLFVALATVFFMLHVMVPMFVDVFSRFDAELPALTRMIIKISNLLSAYALFFVLVIILLAIFIYKYRHKRMFRKYSSLIILKLPVIGNISKLVYQQRFFHAMSLLISARTPVLHAIQLVNKMISFYSLEEDLMKIEKSILSGMSLNESMKGSVFFDKRVISIIKVAEEVNQLDAIFANLNSRMTDDLNQKMAVLNSLLEPILIIFVGILVAIILIAMYLPMFQLSTTIY